MKQERIAKAVSDTHDISEKIKNFDVSRKALYLHRLFNKAGKIIHRLLYYKQFAESDALYEDICTYGVDEYGKYFSHASVNGVIRWNGLGSTSERLVFLLDLELLLSAKP